MLERDPVWAAKEAALRLIYRQPRALRRTRAFQAYVGREGQGLVDFATWCAISRANRVSTFTTPASTASLLALAAHSVP